MSSPYWFDKRLGDAAVEFFPRYLRLTTAEWTRKPFHLAEWQAHHTRQIFGWRRRDGTRRYRRVRGFVPKKNGKTEWFAGIAHLLTVGDAEQGAEVFSYARNEEQARIIYTRALRMVELDVLANGAPGPLASLYDMANTGKSLFCPNLFSAFKPLAGGTAGKHGPSVHGALGDEAHEWANGDIHQALVDGMIARRQPLDAIFTTAGTLKTYAHGLYEDTKAIVADPSVDPECYAFIYEADDRDDWTSPEVWKKANPNFAASVKEAALASSCAEALRKPSKENDFKRMHLGLWTEQLIRAIPMHLWRNNTRAPEDLKLWQRLDDELAGRTCRAGVDLASSHDVAALCYCFEPVALNGRYTFLRRFFMPAATIAERDSPRTPFKQWRDQGALIETPGSVTDYDFIEEQLKRDAQKFRIKQSDPKGTVEFDIAIDMFQATQFTTHMMGLGFKVARYGQEHANFNGPCRFFEDLFAIGRIEHGNHPVAQWMYRNACIHKNHKGYIKPDKAAASDNIDGWVAELMALGLTIRAPAKPDVAAILASGSVF